MVVPIQNDTDRTFLITAVSSLTNPGKRPAFEIAALDSGKTAPLGMAQFYSSYTAPIGPAGQQMPLNHEPVIASMLLTAMQNAVPGYIGHNDLQRALGMYAQNFTQTIQQSTANDIIDSAIRQGYNINGLSANAQQTLNTLRTQYGNTPVANLDANDANQLRLINFIDTMLPEISLAEIPMTLHRDFRIGRLEQVLT